MIKEAGIKGYYMKAKILKAFHMIRCTLAEIERQREAERPKGKK
jgi:hypothetical protein